MWLFNFHENQLQVQSEDKDAVLLKDYMLKGNFLPSHFVHLDQVSVSSSTQDNFDFLKNYIGKNALESNLLGKPIFISHIIKLLKSESKIFFDEAKFSGNILNPQNNIYQIELCTTQACDKKKYKITINTSIKTIDLEVIDSENSRNYSEKLNENNVD